MNNNTTIPTQVTDEESQRLTAEAERQHALQLEKIQKVATHAAAMTQQAAAVKK
jgi:hypothetical protein